VSEENVEIVWRSIDAFNRRDLDLAGQDWDAEAVLDWSRSEGVDAGTYRGRETIRAFWGAWLEMFDQFDFKPTEFIEGGEHVVIPNLTRLRGRDGVEVEARSVLVATVREGRIVAWRIYQDRAEALKAVGLEE
jgi:ketosteroid isomerase-like protein